MEQKMKQKRMTSGMIQASDVRKNSATLRTNSGNRRELHGRNVTTNLDFSINRVVSGYDGPLMYSMARDNNPDQVISILSSPDSIDGELF
jgi:hypothetical protein